MQHKVSVATWANGLYFMVFEGADIAPQRFAVLKKYFLTVGTMLILA